MYELKKDILNYVEFKIKPFHYFDAEYGKHKINYVITKTKEHDCIDLRFSRVYLTSYSFENFEWSICYEEGNIKKIEEEQRMKKYNQNFAQI